MAFKQPLPDAMLQRLQEPDPRTVPRRQAHNGPLASQAITNTRQDTSTRRDFSYDEAPRRGRGVRRGAGQGRISRGGAVQRPRANQAVTQQEFQDRMQRLQDMISGIIVGQAQCSGTTATPQSSTAPPAP